MKRLCVVILLAFAALAQAAAPQPPSVVGRSWMVGDLSSGQLLAAQKADERVEPASLTKIMTAYVVFQALRDKKLALGQQVTVSERAWRAPGSRMFIRVGTQVSVGDLVRGMLVLSRDEACSALGEAVAGRQ